MTGAERSLRADARRNRARVLDVAAEAFAAEGPTVPIDEIARRAGLGIGTVYRHFPTKEALFEAIVLDRIQRLAGTAQAARSDPDPGTAFFTYFTCLVEAGTVNKALFEALATAGEEVDTAALRAASAELLTALGDLLTGAQRAGAVRADVAVGDLKAMLAGALVMERAGAGPPGRMIAIVCDGLRATPPH